MDLVDVDRSERTREAYLLAWGVHPVTDSKNEVTKPISAATVQSSGGSRGMRGVQAQSPVPRGGR